MQRVMCVLEVLMAYTYTAKIRGTGIGDSSLLYAVIIIIATSIGYSKMSDSFVVHRCNDMFY